MKRLSEELNITMPFTETDIGGTDSAGGVATAQWLSMVGYDRALVFVELGTWNAADDLDEAKLQQAQDSAGTGVKDLTTSASGGDYDEDAPLDADGNRVIFDIRAEDLDAANNFTHFRPLFTENDNTDVDNISCVIIRATARHQKEQLTGAAVAGALVYVTKG